MGETPDFSHLTSTDYESVYEPAEDTFLFMDALVADVDALKRLRPLVCVEVGCGSGAVITFLAKLLGGSTAFYLCSDVNSNATSVTAKTGEQNGILLNPIVTDLVSALASRLEGFVDVLLFNPPYVVTPNEEVGGKGIEASWAGGERGRKVMDRIFPLVPKLLSQNGIFYLVAIKENDADEIGDFMRKLGLQMTTVMSRRSGPERLSVLKFTKSSKDPL